jgi:hypothetical protein
MIRVYVKVNEENYITEINSSIFLKDSEDWIEIDAGEGDKYAHAQGNYFEKGICDDLGRYNYKLIDGEVVEVPEDEKPIPQVIPQISTEERISALEEAMLEMLLGGM